LGVEPIGLHNKTGLSQCNCQVRWIENIKMDFIGRIENIKEDYKKLPFKKGALLHRNQSPARDGLKFYCEESKVIVEDFYKEDFGAFGYEIQEKP
jgi:hypothetical protein